MSRSTVHRACTRCGEKKPREAFSNDRSRNSGVFPWCKACVLEIRQRDRQIIVNGEGGPECPVCGVSLGERIHGNRRYCSMSCKDKARAYRTYGLEPEEYRALIASSDGRCPICQKKSKRLQIDHNHKTGETLGAVCINCNIKVLAYTYHDVEIARRLLDFLENPPVRALFGERRYVGPENVSQLHRMWAWNGTPEDAENPPALHLERGAA